MTAWHINATIIKFITCTGICDLSYFLDKRKKLIASPRQVSELTRHKIDDALTKPSRDMIDERSINVPPVTSITAASFKKEIDITMNCII